MKLPSAALVLGLLGTTTNATEVPEYCGDVGKYDSDYPSKFIDMSYKCGQDGGLDCEHVCVRFIYASSCLHNFSDVHDSLGQAIADQIPKDGYFKTSSSDPWVVSFSPGISAMHNRNVLPLWQEAVDNMLAEDPEADPPTYIRFHSYLPGGKYDGVSAEESQCV